MSNVGEIPGVEFLETAPKFRKRKKNSSSCVYVLHKTSKFSRPSRAVTAKKCIKKCNARAKLFFFGYLILSMLLFLTFSLPSSLLKRSLSSDDGNENVTRKCNVISFVLLRHSFNSFNFYRNGELPRNQIGRSGVQVKRMKNSPPCVNVLHKTLNLVISRCCFAEKCTKI